MQDRRREGDILHDLFLYDSTHTCEKRRSFSWTHTSKTALKNAKQQIFELNEIEKILSIIICDRLLFRIPKTKEEFYYDSYRQILQGHARQVKMMTEG